MGAVLKKKNADVPYSSANFNVFVTKVLKLRTFLFELYVLISIAIVQTPPLKKKKRKENDRGESLDSLIFFLGEGASVHWLSLGTLRCHDVDDNDRERQKSNRLNRQNDNSAHVSTCITLFCTFLFRLCTTTTGKCLISRGGRKQTTAKVSFPF